VLACAALTACSAPDPGPSQGRYTVEFPTTEAAVATDFVQVFVFDVIDETKRGSLCDDLISTRITAPATLKPSVDPPAPATNICEMRAGIKPVTIPYGEHALLAVAQRRNKDQLQDLLIGCTIMTIGDGDAPLPIQLRLVNPTQQLPTTNCASVGDYCGGKCS
jgi:hypothetical protein